MVNHLIKICGIGDVETAAKAVSAGAHLIGMIFDSSSPRNVTVDKAVLIAHTVKKAGGSPVAVFVNQSVEEMTAICKATDIQIVQLHGKMSRASHHQLAHEYQRIYVQHLSEQGELMIEESFKYLNPERDMILIDHEKSGQGNKVNRAGFVYSLPFPWFLAGGLTAKNVSEMIKEWRPTGVDVSSGVEREKGKKDLSLVQQFITAVRGYHDK